jgi:hypothetical protein
MRRNILLWILGGIIVIVGTESARAQEISIDWATKKVTSQPTEIHKGETIKVSVSEVNNILYDYTIDIQLQITSNSDDLAALLKLLPDIAKGVKAPLRAEGCPGNLAQAKVQLEKINAAMNNPDNNLNPEVQTDKKPISLQATERGWTAIEAERDKLQKSVDYLSTSCKSDKDAQDFLSGPYHQFDNFRKRVEGPHIAQGVAQASTGDVASVKVTVTEKWRNVSVDSQTWVLHFSSVLNLSGGVLFSTLPDVSYIRRKIPTTDQSGAATTTEVLGVEGGSRPVPMLLGLLNYRIPYLDSDKWGLDFSSGPAIRLGGQSNTNSFGYFVGLSFNLWHRLYITPGVHVGQYADFPAGFAPGTPIPTDFGELVPVKRWTARFAIGITYKTLDLGALKGQAKPSTPPKTEETKK